MLNCTISIPKPRLLPNGFITQEVHGRVMDLLAVDIGAGTQDILLYREKAPLENSVKMVMPSPTVIVGKSIEQARISGRDVFLSGPTMGGGASTRAVRAHLEAGFRVYATESAALTIKDDLDQVRAMGVEVVKDGPSDALKIKTGDLNISLLKQTFELFGVNIPQNLALAVQDHGYSPHKSNRIVRFEQMIKIMKSGGGRLESFAYFDPPAIFSRMCSAKNDLKGEGFSPLIMDTGPAALLGATCDPRYKDPALILNLGNGHTIGAVVVEGKMTALFEHHTRVMTPEKLFNLSNKICEGTLTNDEVFEDGGHGAYVEDVPGADMIRSIMVTGPNRERVLSSGILRRLGKEGKCEVVAAAPGGDMMISGCIGLIEAWKRSVK